MSDIDPADVIAELLSPQFDRRRTEGHHVDQVSVRSPGVLFRLVPLDEIDEPAPVSGAPADAAELQPLVRSVAEHGLVQPLLVRRDGGRYRLLAGRKRFAAARVAGTSPVPCLVHDVDDARADAIVRAADVRADVRAGAPRNPAGTDIHVVAHVSEAVATIQSTASLLATEGSPMAHRVALDLLRAEAWRASWQLRAAAILEHSYRWHFRPLLLGAALGRVGDGFASECRLHGIVLELNVVDWNASADLDEDAFVCGVSGAVIASAGLAGSGVPQVAVAAHQSDTSTLTVEVTQHASAPDSSVATRFFDASWSDRPGGWGAMVGAATARAVAERHGGKAVFVNNGHGSTIRLTFVG